MKKISKIKFVVILWCMLFIVSCTNTTSNNSSNVESSQKNKAVAIDTATTFKAISVVSEKEIIGGWLKEAIEQQIVINKLGSPEKKGEDEYWGATGTYVQNWEYTSLGITLEMESESQGGIKKVRSIIITQPCNLTTSQGIGIGSDENTVKEKYFKLIDASNSNATTIVVGSIYGGTIFTLEGGFVSKIFIGAIAE